MKNNFKNYPKDANYISVYRWKEALKKELLLIKQNVATKGRGEPNKTILVQKGNIDSKTGERWTPHVFINIDVILGVEK